METEVEIAHAFDVETSHRSVGARRLMSIACTAREFYPNGRSSEINTFSAVIEWPGGLEFDDVTRRFWDANPLALLAGTSNGRPPEAVARDLATHIAEVRRGARKRKARYTLVTDNEHFDVKWVDWFLSAYGPDDALPLRHDPVDGYLHTPQVVDVAQRIEALRAAGIAVVPRPRPLHKLPLHVALDDARWILMRYQHLKLRSQHLAYAIRNAELTVPAFANAFRFDAARSGPRRALQ